MVKGWVDGGRGNYAGLWAATEGDCWGIPNMKGVRGEGLRLSLQIYVLISRRGKKHDHYIL